MAARGTTVFTIDTTGLRAFARSLRFVSTEAAANLRDSMQEVGDAVAKEARDITSSDQARPTIKAKVSGVNVTVEVGTTIGRLLESGNKGGSSSAKAGVFRHPTGRGGSGRWVDQKMDPAIHKAMENKREEMVELIKVRIDALVQRMLAHEFDAVEV